MIIYSSSVLSAKAETYESTSVLGSTVDSQFNMPYGIAVDSSGNIYVADTGNYRIQKFSSDGKFLLSWGNQEIGRAFV